MNKDLINSIKKIVGESGIILGKEVEQRKAGIWIEEPLKAKAIIRPRNTKEVSEVLFLCNENNLAVVPQGGLT